MSAMLLDFKVRIASIRSHISAMEDNDPITQFFPDEPDVNLYHVLSVSLTATASEIKSAYRRLALVHHPDKHAASSAETQKNASTRFQQVGFAYTVLGDEKRRKRYDDTGKTDEGMEWGGKGDDGWETYFEEMFEKVTRGKLDEMKKEYQGEFCPVSRFFSDYHAFLHAGSAEETNDLRAAYIETGGSIDGIMSCIPHCHNNDEPRFLKTINDLIAQGELEALPVWAKGLKDMKARTNRQRKAEKEAKEAEELANELGVWDEFYGSGKAGKRKGKGRGKSRDEREDKPDGEAALQALIQGRQKKMGDFFDSLAAKYAEPVTKGTKRARSTQEEEPDIDEDEFARIQQRLVAGKTGNSKTGKTGRSK